LSQISTLCSLNLGNWGICPSGRQGIELGWEARRYFLFRSSGRGAWFDPLELARRTWVTSRRIALVREAATMWFHREPGSLHHFRGNGWVGQDYADAPTGR